MAVNTLVLDREIDLPPVIVWDALVDPDLVGGWLGEAVIDPEVGGGYRLAWLGSVEFPPLVGVIERMIGHELLQVATDRHGTIRFELEPLVGGTRGAATLFTVHVDLDTEVAFLPRVSANWTTALDQLEELLRGHPVNWVGRRSVDPSAPSQPRLA